MPTLQPYNRQAAVAYAHRWAFGRNPAYSNFDGMGGESLCRHRHYEFHPDLRMVLPVVK